MSDLLAEILELYLDFKHWFNVKKRRKFEKENKLPKSIVWHPLTKPLFWFFVISIPISFSLFFIFGSNNNELTKQKMKEISIILEKEKKQLGKYPEKLETIVRNNPLRKQIILDYWSSNFIYKLSKDSLNYSIISLGKDKKLNTSDDIVFSSN